MICCSTTSGRGLDEIRALLSAGRTMVMVGASGHGKSTLTNALVGAEVLTTRAIRDDGKGRHTSVRRELLVVPGGGAVIDTPGLRGVGSAPRRRLAGRGVPRRGGARAAVPLPRLPPRGRAGLCDHEPRWPPGRCRSGAGRAGSGSSARPSCGGGAHGRPPPRRAGQAAGATSPSRLATGAAVEPAWIAARRPSDLLRA